MKIILLAILATFTSIAFALQPLSSKEIDQLQKSFPVGWNWNATYNSLLPDYVLWNFPTNIPRPSLVRKDFKVKDFQPISNMQFGNFFSKNDLAKERAGQFEKMDKSQLITVKYGNGKKQILVISALDCPTCKMLERNLMQKEKQLNATIYYIPVKLDTSDDPVLTKLFCADGDKGAAWIAYWRKNVIPQKTAPGCTFSAKDGNALWNFFGRINTNGNVTGTPTLVFEDGTTFAGIPEETKFIEIFGGNLTDTTN
jgi:hypothetical protein